MHQTSSQNAIEDDIDPLEEDDPLSILIERIAAVKLSFEDFHARLQAENNVDGEEEEGSEELSDDDFEEGDSDTEDDNIDKKIQKFETLLSRLQGVVSQMESAEKELVLQSTVPDAGLTAPTLSDDDDEEDEVIRGLSTSGHNPVVTEYEKLIQERLVPFLEAVNAVGGEVQKQGSYVTQAFGAQREMLAMAAERPRPEQEKELIFMLEGTTDALACVDQINEESRGALRKHTAMVAGAVTALGWVTAPDPRQHIGDALNAVPVYGRQIQEEHRGEEHAALVSSLKLLLRGLQEYVATYHPRGLSWNARREPPPSPPQPGGALAGGGYLGGGPGAVGFTWDQEARADAGLILSEFDGFMVARVVPFVEAAYALKHDSVRAQTDCVQRAFKAQRDFLGYVSRCRCPAREDLEILLRETSDALAEVEECCDPASGERLHLSMVASGMPCLGWVSVPMNPSAYIGDMINSIPVYGDKIERESRGKVEGPLHQGFVTAFRDMLRGLNEYVRAHHPRGLAWNMAGADLREVLAAEVSQADSPYS